MRGHSHRPRGLADDSRYLAGLQPGHHPQHDDLRLLTGQRRGPVAAGGSPPSSNVNSAMPQFNCRGEASCGVRPCSMIVVAPAAGKPMVLTRATSVSSTSQRTTRAARL